MEIKELIEVIDSHYPKNIVLNDPILLHDTLYKKLITTCIKAKSNKSQWEVFLAQLKNNLDMEITEFVLLSELNPSFIAVFLVEQYEWDKVENYQPMQLILKISVIAPVYSLYFDNLDSKSNKRLIRSNPVTEKELLAFNQVQQNIAKSYPNYSHLDFSMTYHILPQLGNISDVNKRKPYLDECIFGLYLSVHPHNITVDKLQKIILK